VSQGSPRHCRSCQTCILVSDSPARRMGWQLEEGGGIWRIYHIIISMGIHVYQLKGGGGGGVHMEYLRMSRPRMTSSISISSQLTCARVGALDRVCAVVWVEKRCSNCVEAWSTCFGVVLATRNMGLLWPWPNTSAPFCPTARLDNAATSYTDPPVHA
jgi:hypothetical protein